MKVKITLKTGAVIIKDVSDEKDAFLSFGCTQPLGKLGPTLYRVTWCKYCDCKNIEKVECYYE